MNATQPHGVFTIDASAHLERTDPVVVDRLADGLWTAASGDYRAVFAEGTESIVAVNTFGTRATARAYRQAIESTVPGKPVGTLLCTIDHLDHAGYGTVLAPEAAVVAHELCARVIERRAASGQRRPGRVHASGREELTLDGVTLRLSYLGPTQGTGNVAVHFPDQRTLFLVGPRSDARYGLFPDVHFRHVTQIWREFASLDVDVVVPGRGACMDSAALRRAADYVDAVAEASQQAFADGLPIWVLSVMADYVGQSLRDAFGDLGGFDDHIGIAAMRLVHYYLMGGWGMEDTSAPETLLEAGR
jgi:hypothetical protein